MSRIEPGTTVAGFRVTGLLGRGGMASVYKAEQIRLRRMVALKILAPALAADEQFVQRFHLEGINAASLEHANIVPVYEAGEDGHHVFLAMRFVDGRSLAGRLGEERALAPDTALGVLADVARALEYAHERGFVHRDVKPGNVLIEKDGRVFLSDFGLSKAVGSRGLTGTGQWMGTLEYMAPEQAGSDFLDYRADIYALGCMAFECLTGETPYRGENPLAIMMAHAQSEVPRATARNLSLPPSVDDVFRRVLAKNPNERYDAALDLVESLAAAISERRLTSDALPADAVRRFTTTSGTDRGRPPPDVGPEPAVTTVPEPAPPSAPPAPPEVVRSGACPSCFGPLARGDMYCGGCGSRVFACPSCEHTVVEGDRFCQHCGTHLS